MRSSKARRSIVAICVTFTTKSASSPVGSAGSPTFPGNALSCWFVVTTRDRDRDRAQLGAVALVSAHDQHRAPNCRRRTTRQTEVGPPQLIAQHQRSSSATNAAAVRDPPDRNRRARVEVLSSMHRTAAIASASPPPATSEVEELHEELARLRAELAAREREAERRERELRDSCEATVRALAEAVEARDVSTARHAERVAAYGLELARACGIDTAGSADLEFGFLLHDIGKIGIADAILHKPGRLTPDERDAMRRHPVIGEEIVRGVDFLAGARQVVRSHHERWDGAGYPDRLPGERIPLAARVFAVADTFDALTSDRPYRAATSFRAARRVIADAAGTQFDPAVAAAFDDVPDARFDEIRRALT